MPAAIVARSETSFTVQVVIPYGSSMLDFEQTIQERLNQAGVVATQEALQQFDTDGSPIAIGSVKFTSKGQLPKEYQTPYGVATVARASAGGDGEQEGGEGKAEEAMGTQGGTFHGGRAVSTLTADPTGDRMPERASWLRWDALTPLPGSWPPGRGRSSPRSWTRRRSSSGSRRRG